MTTKTCVWIGLFIGSSVGEFIPTLWGSDPFSLAAILFGALGGLLGIWAGYSIGRAYFA